MIFIIIDPTVLIEWKSKFCSSCLSLVYVVRSSFLLADNFQWLIRADTKFSRTTRYNEQTSWKLHSSWGETWNNECQLFESLHIWCLIVIEISKFSFNPVWSIDISWNCSKDFLLKFRQIFYGFLYIVPIILFSVVYNIPKFLEVQIVNITTVLVICIVHCCNSRKPSENSLFVLFQQFVFQLMTTLWQLCDNWYLFTQVRNHCQVTILHNGSHMMHVSQHFGPE